MAQEQRNERPAQGRQQGRRDAASEQKQGLVARVFGAASAIIGATLLSCILSVCLEWGGMFLGVWEEPGAQHALGGLQTELGWVNEDFKQATFGTLTPANAVEEVLQWIYPGYQRGIGDLLGWLDSPGGGMTEMAGKEMGRTLREYAVAAVLTTMIFMLRCVILLFSLPVFVVFGIVGLVDGLCQRDVRRFTGARESDRRFAMASRMIGPSFIGAWVVYLSSPISIHPNIVILPCALLTGVTLSMSAKYFAKYF